MGGCAVIRVSPILDSGDGHKYIRVWAWCDGCRVEGEAVIGSPDRKPSLREQAAANADLDASGRCTRCRAAHAGLVL